MDHLLHDTKYALRGLFRTPGFTMLAVAMLALGIGANTALFTVVNGVLLRDLPYEAPEQLVVLRHQSREQNVMDGAFSPQDFDDLSVLSRSFGHLASYFYVPGQTGVNLGGDGEPLRLPTAFVSADFFRTLGVAALVGRTPTAEEATPGSDQVVVLGHGLWQRRFGGDPSVVGRTIQIDGQAFTVVGVMPRAFSFPAREVEVWAPVSLIGEDAIPHRRGLRWLGVVGRLAPDASVEAAGADVDAVLGRLAERYPETNGEWTTARLTAIRDEIVGDVRTPLLLLLGAVGLVLLIACANLANLLLARGAARGREVAIRTALGAERGRLIRQLLTESLILAGLGGAVGVVVAVWGVDAVVALAGDTLPRSEAVAPDARVIVFAVAVTALTGIVAGLLPALRVSAMRAAAALREGGRGGTDGRSRVGARGALVVAETALAVLLLSGAGLMLNSLWRMLRVDTGFRTENVLSLSITIPFDQSTTPAELGVARDRILERIRLVPGVVAAGGSKSMPLHGGGEPLQFTLPERPDDVVRPRDGAMIVTPGYFEALGVPVLRGRAFDDRDGRGPDRLAVIVNETLARQLWPGREAVGRSVRLNGTEVPVVGVVADVRHAGLTEAPGGAIYVPATLAPRVTTKIFVRTAASPLALVDPIRRAIREVDPEQPISDIALMRDVVRQAVAHPRMVALLLSLLSALALILAAGGLYGVITYAVAQRTREIGIRMALGARPTAVRRAVLGEAGRLAAAGGAIGIVAALGLGRLISGLLFGVTPADPATYAAVAAVLAVTALLAGYVPARRATRIDPMIAMRGE